MSDPNVTVNVSHLFKTKCPNEHTWLSLLWSVFQGPKLQHKNEKKNLKINMAVYKYVALTLGGT